MQTCYQVVHLLHFPETFVLIAPLLHFMSNKKFCTPLHFSKMQSFAKLLQPKHNFNNVLLNLKCIKKLLPLHHALIMRVKQEKKK